MKYIKGFDENLICRGYQFEVGKEYKIDNGKKPKLCSDSVFHFCENIQQVHQYYKCYSTLKNRFCEIEVLGELVSDEEKCGSNHIRIVREIKGKELNNLLLMINGNTGIFNTGNWNTGDRNTGNRNTGDRNTGNRNTGNQNTGNRNIGNQNIGNQNTGNRNIGNQNTGNRNTGNRNTGNQNTGDWNIGNWNTGDWNTINGSTGFFNTVEQEVMIFNKPSGMTQREFWESEYYDAITNVSFYLTEWIWYTEEEKKKSIIRQATKGYLKKYTYKEACANWWNKLDEEDKETIQKIPNFDKDIFFEITGIKV